MYVLANVPTVSTVSPSKRVPRPGSPPPCDLNHTWPLALFCSALPLLSSPTSLSLLLSLPSLAHIWSRIASCCTTSSANLPHSLPSCFRFKLPPFLPLRASFFSISFLSLIRLSQTSARWLKAVERAAFVSLCHARRGEKFNEQRLPPPQKKRKKELVVDLAAF